MTLSPNERPGKDERSSTLSYQERLQLPLPTLLACLDSVDVFLPMLSYRSLAQARSREGRPPTAPGEQLVHFPMDGGSHEGPCPHCPGSYLASPLGDLEPCTPPVSVAELNKASRL